MSNKDRFTIIPWMKNVNTIWLLGFGVIGLFITPLVKLASMAAIAWACWEIYQDWQDQ